MPQSTQDREVGRRTNNYTKITNTDRTLHQEFYRWNSRGDEECLARLISGQLVLITTLPILVLFVKHETQQLDSINE